MQRGMNEDEGMLFENYHTQKTKRGILQILDKTHTPKKKNLSSYKKYFYIHLHKLNF